MSKKEDWTMAEWRDYYKGLAQRAYDNYQETGAAKYDSQFLKYDKIVDAFNGYLEHKNENDVARATRMRNIDAYIDRHVTNDSYTRNEVLDMFRDIESF